LALLDKAVIGQSTVIAFDTAFNAVALIFVFAAPVLVTFKICLHRFAHKAAKDGRGSSTGNVAPVANRPIVPAEQSIHLLSLSAGAGPGVPDANSDTHLHPQLQSAM
jgi:DHA2 family multidrug resistance protein